MREGRGEGPTPREAKRLEALRVCVRGDCVSGHIIMGGAVRRHLRCSALEESQNMRKLWLSRVREGYRTAWES